MYVRRGHRRLAHNFSCGPPLSLLRLSRFASLSCTPAYFTLEHKLRVTRLRWRAREGRYCSRHCLVARLPRTMAIILVCSKRCTIHLPAYPSRFPLLRACVLRRLRRAVVIILIVVLCELENVSFCVSERMRGVFAFSVNRY